MLPRFEFSCLGEHPVSCFQDRRSVHRQRGREGRRWYPTTPAGLCRAIRAGLLWCRFGIRTSRCQGGFLGYAIFSGARATICAGTPAGGMADTQSRRRSDASRRQLLHKRANYTAHQRWCGHATRSYLRSLRARCNSRLRPACDGHHPFPERRPVASAAGTDFDILFAKVGGHLPQPQACRAGSPPRRYQRASRAEFAAAQPCFRTMRCSEHPLTCARTA